MKCLRCGGLWAELGEDSHCIQCGNRTMPGHPHCSVGETVTDAERKQQRRKVGNSFAPLSINQVPSKMPKSAGRPPLKRIEKELKDKPQTGPIKEHPYIEWLAERWQDLEDKITILVAEQQELKRAAQAFEESYPQKHTGNSQETDNKM